MEKNKKPELHRKRKYNRKKEIPGWILFLTDKKALHRALSSFVSKAASST